MNGHIRRTMGRVLWVMVWLTAGASALGQTPQGVAVDPPSQSAILPPQLLWPGVVVIVLIALFVTAALTGPIIRANMREEVAEGSRR